MHYVYLACAVVMETFGTSFMKMSNGFTKPIPSIISVCCFIVALFLMSLTLKYMPIGIVYAIWSGMGIALITAIGWIFFGQKLDLPALIGIGMILGGVIVLNTLSKSTMH